MHELHSEETPRPVRILPIYEVDSSNPISQEQVEQFLTIAKENPLVDKNEFPSLAQSPERKALHEELTKITLHMAEWIRSKLGIDISPRLISTEEIYILPENQLEIIDQKQNRVAGLDTDADALIDPISRQIAVSDAAPSQAITDMVAHEIIHGLQLTKLGMTLAGIRSIRIPGISEFGIINRNDPENSYPVTQEVLVEFLKFEILSDYDQRNSTEYTKFSPYKFVVMAYLVLVQEAVTKGSPMTPAYQKEETAVRYQLYKSILLGDTGFFKPLLDFHGENSPMLIENTLRKLLLGSVQTDWPFSPESYMRYSMLADTLIDEKFATFNIFENTFVNASKRRSRFIDVQGFQHTRKSY